MKGILIEIEQMWTDQKLQRLSMNVGLNYFRVKDQDNVSRTDEDQVIERLLQIAKEAERKAMDSDELDEEDERHVEESPWLNRTGWKEMFVGKNMKEMLKYIDTENDLEPELLE